MVQTIQTAKGKLGFLIPGSVAVATTLSLEWNPSKKD
jgi:hypothetical protein